MDQYQPRKSGDTNVVFPIITLWEFFSDAQGQLEMAIIDTCKYKKDSIKKQPRKRDDALFPIITLRELSVAMETRVPI